MSKQSAPKDAPQTLEKDNTKNNTPSKQERFLSALLAVGFQGLRGLECAGKSGIKLLFNDESIRFWSSCLHTDVSTAQKELDITIARKNSPYRSPAGHTANFKRYWLASYNDALKTLKEVNRLRVKRNKKPIAPEKSKLILSVFY